MEGWRGKVRRIAGWRHTSGCPNISAKPCCPPNSWVRSKAARQASNYCIQSAVASSRVALSLCMAFRSVARQVLAQLIGPIHDELTGMVHRDDAGACDPRRCMRR